MSAKPVAQTSTSAPQRPDEARLAPARVELLLLFAGVALAVCFALVTEHAWEDYYITYRSSKNLAMGHGLVFQPGERVHAFTSPIGVLLPALLSYLTGNTSDALVLWLFRLISAALFVATGLAIVRAHRRLGVAGAATGFTLVLAATEAKIVAFSVNGQESAFLVLCICASWACLNAGTRFHVGTLALCWAGLQYTRPDGFIYGACVALGWLGFVVGDGLRGRLAALRRVGAAAALALVVYSPWLAFTTWYYGTPVPHTVVAKGAFAPPHDPATLLLALLSLPFDVVAGVGATRLVFAPTYVDFGGWPEAITGLARLLGSLAGAYWMLPFAGRNPRAMSLAFALSLLYLSRVVVPAPWYLPAAGILGVLTLGLMGDDLLRLGSRLAAAGMAVAAERVRRTTAALGIAIATFTVTVLALSTYQLAIQQREIETGLRTRIGLWLRDNAGPHDRVFLEPLGYIGFFSQMKMLDYPGLSSPEVVAVHPRERGFVVPWGTIIERLKPEWIVLRHVEASILFEKAPALREQYTLAQVYDESARLRAYGWIPGINYLLNDSRFAVFRRQSQRAN